MKVKVFFQEDIIAIRVPTDISFQMLKDKLCDRLKINEEISIQFKDEHSNNYAALSSDQDLEIALQQTPKLMLYVSFAS